MTTKELPQNVRLINGLYVQVRIMRHGRLYTKNFGLDSSLARELAGIHASEKRKEKLMGLAGIRATAKRMKFAEARKIFYIRHYEKYRDPSTHAPRTEGSKRSAQDILNILGAYFDTYFMDEIKAQNVENFKTLCVETNALSYATFNKYRGILYSVFAELENWITLEKITPIQLPAVNPCKAVGTLVANERSRVPDAWELAAAYTWCQTNDVGLWDAIEKALLTALRKQDLVALDGTLTVKGIQQKTGEKFDLPITLDKPVDLTNYRRRWNALRNAMGWKALGTPKHTTWHDLRHWAPTMLGESGFSTKIIQNYTGHSTEASAERYTNVRRKSLEPAVDVVRKELERIKESNS